MPLSYEKNGSETKMAEKTAEKVSVKNNVPLVMPKNEIKRFNLNKSSNRKVKKQDDRELIHLIKPWLALSGTHPFRTKANLCQLTYDQILFNRVTDVVRFNSLSNPKGCSHYLDVLPRMINIFTRDDAYRGLQVIDAGENLHPHKWDAVIYRARTLAAIYHKSSICDKNSHSNTLQHKEYYRGPIMLVHCSSGRHRSPSLVSLLLAATEPEKYSEYKAALRHVRCTRKYAKGIPITDDIYQEWRRF